MSNYEGNIIYLIQHGPHTVSLGPKPISAFHAGSNNLLLMLDIEDIGAGSFGTIKIWLPTARGQKALFFADDLIITTNGVFLIKLAPFVGGGTYAYSQTIDIPPTAEIELLPTDASSIIYSLSAILMTT